MMKVFLFISLWFVYLLVIRVASNYFLHLLFFVIHLNNQTIDFQHTRTQHTQHSQNILFLLFF